MAGFDTRRYQNYIMGGKYSDNTLNVGYAGFNGDAKDNLLSRLGSGFNDFSFTAVMGDVDLSDASANLQADRLTSTPTPMPQVTSGQAVIQQRGPRMDVQQQTVGKQSRAYWRWRDVFRAPA